VRTSDIVLSSVQRNEPRASRVGAALPLLGVPAFWVGIGIARWCYPAGFDWRHMTLSTLLSPRHNPAGGKDDAMNFVAWTGRCRDCSYATSRPTRIEVVFAIEKHARFTGHMAWDVQRVAAATSDRDSPGGSYRDESTLVMT
jgi:hypothetical protein